MQRRALGAATPAHPEIAVIQTLPPEVQRRIAGLRRYWLVHLLAGPNRAQGEAEAAEIQRGHLLYLFEQRERGALLVSGPVLDDLPLRGICIYNLPRREDVEEVVGQDPAVRSGRLRYEIMRWGGIAGDSLSADAPAPG